MKNSQEINIIDSNIVNLKWRLNSLTFSTIELLMKNSSVYALSGWTIIPAHVSFCLFQLQNLISSTPNTTHPHTYNLAFRNKKITSVGKQSPSLLNNPIWIPIVPNWFAYPVLVSLSIHSRAPKRTGLFQSLYDIKIWSADM